ncbi:integrase [Priestia megaterium]|uniref:integrase n=1 Tax=Priestia megaterium TaxID=1404 RepID=UPI0025A3A5DA|nr:integrase [Priestia megaterium]MDM8151344.1 integrase [Priestia megaterium]
MPISQKFQTNSQHIELISVAKSIFTYSITDVNEYKEIFSKWLDLNIISTKSFKNNKWTLIDKYNNRRNLVFDIKDSKLNTTLKCFALSIIEQEFSINHIQQVVSSVHEVIEITHGFNIAYLTALEDYIGKHNYAKRNNLANFTIQFFSFTSIDFSEEFKDVCAPFLNSIQRSRELPNYQHILFFDEKMNFFLEEGSLFERKKYFPIVLWWKLTTIIPLRPIEFLTLQRDCVVKKTETFFQITLPRKKQRATLRRDIDITDTLQINKETYELIQEFHDYSSHSAKNNYLFTYDYYKEHKEFFGSESLKETEFLPRRQLDSLLDQFYSNVLIKKYSYSGSEKLTLGDTRHFAFCNMMLQGFNMLSIARIGGHSRLDKQQHYWGHLKYFSESWVYNFAEKHRRLDHLNKTMPDAYFTEDIRRIINSYKLNKSEEFDNALPVDYGYCVDNNYPNNCSGDCRHCLHYRFHPKKENLNEAINWLTDFSQTLSRKIDEQISLLTYISQTVNYDLTSLTYSITDQEELSYTANELNRLLHQKAMIDSKLPNEVKGFKNE